MPMFVLFWPDKPALHSSLYAGCYWNMWHNIVDPGLFVRFDLRYFLLFWVRVILTSNSVGLATMPHSASYA